MACIGRPRRRWEDIKMDHQEVELGWGGGRHGLAGAGSGWEQVARFCKHGNEPSGIIKCGEFLD